MPEYSIALRALMVNPPRPAAGGDCVNVVGSTPAVVCSIVVTVRAVLRCRRILDRSAIQTQRRALATDTPFVSGI